MLVCTLCSVVLCVQVGVIDVRSLTLLLIAHSFSARLHMITMMFLPADRNPPPVVVVGGSAGALPPSAPAPLSKTYRYICTCLQPMLLIVIARELRSLDYMTFIMGAQGRHD